MIPWNVAYQRLHNSGELEKVFRRRLPPSAFRYRVYAVKFSADAVNITKASSQGAVLAPSATAGTFGVTSGPVLQTFVSGAVILGVTASAMGPQEAVFTYARSETEGRADLFGLQFSTTDTRELTGATLVQADVLLGQGDTQGSGIFPGKEIAIYANGGILCRAASLITVGNLSATVAYHCMIPAEAV